MVYSPFDHCGGFQQKPSTDRWRCPLEQQCLGMHWPGPGNCGVLWNHFLYWTIRSGKEAAQDLGSAEGRLTPVVLIAGLMGPSFTRWHPWGVGFHWHSCLCFIHAHLYPFSDSNKLPGAPSHILVISLLWSLKDFLMSPRRRRAPQEGNRKEGRRQHKTSHLWDHDWCEFTAAKVQAFWCNKRK